MRGVELTRAFYDEVMVGRLHGTPHAAGRVGAGSDVVGRDDERSRDHDWGSRLAVFVDDPESLASDDLPTEFRGYPVSVHIQTVASFSLAHLGLDPERDWDAFDWLTITGQAALEVTAGSVFVDQTGGITRLRERLLWYPDDVWYYLLASAWRRLDQELPFVGRTADRGDDIGSRVLTSRLVRDVIHLGLLVERTWAPYPKWLGSTFAELEVGTDAGRCLTAALAASNWRDREAGLLEAIEVLAPSLARSVGGLPGSVAVPFHDRPYRTVNAEITAVLQSLAVEAPLARLPVGIGSVEQWCDNVDVLAYAPRRVQLRHAYEGWVR